MTPEFGVLSRVQFVVGNDEVAHVAYLFVGLSIESVDFGSFESTIWKQRDQPEQRALDQVNARGFQRLEKSSRESQREAVPVPDAAPLARDEANPARRR